MHVDEGLSTEDLFPQHFESFNVSIRSEILRSAVFLCLLFRTMYMMFVPMRYNFLLLCFSIFLWVHWSQTHLWFRNFFKIYLL